jgi:hypothetical protein
VSLSMARSKVDRAKTATGLNHKLSNEPPAKNATGRLRPIGECSDVKLVRERHTS